MTIMKYLKIGAVILGAVLITALGIDAADTLQGNGGTLLSQVAGTAGGCPAGMASVETVPGVRCVDAFEVSAAAACPHKDPGNIFETGANVDASGCSAVSSEGEKPWRYITREQAMALCARRGARLPSSEEWYRLALGLPAPEESCNTDTQELTPAGSFSACVSPAGAYDLVGNVWEWVADDVIEGRYNGRELPATGYVAQVDNGGVATLTGDEASDQHGSDYFWAKHEGAYGVIRGGFYGSARDAGLYTIHADTPPNSAGTAIGFRCVI